MSIFSTLSMRRLKRNKIDLSHEVKMSMNMGDLVPILCQEILPGDSFRVNTEHMIRLAPMLAPMMHRVNVYCHFFFVPNRLLWSEWEDFITGGTDGTAEPVSPYFAFDNSSKDLIQNGSLGDYMGIPVIPGSIGAGLQISALPFRAYQLIYNEYFRDQTLSPEIDFSKGSGQVVTPDLEKILSLRKRAWEKDYFTSALPWSQRGGEASLPLESQVTYKPISEIFKDDGTAPTSTGYAGAVQNTTNLHIQMDTGVGGVNARIENIEDISSGSVSINELRKAVRLQEWLERSARGGARYIEQILSHFGVRSSDARLQRPEFLGGSVNPIVVSEVLNNAGSMEDTLLQPIGTMAGHGISVGSSSNWQRSFEEHGFVIGIMSVLPKTAYQQGINKMFRRFDKFDYYWPEFAQLGEQEVYNYELFFDPAGVDNTQTFGYQSRYAEYKYNPSRVAGDFRDTLEYWHMGRVFTTRPNLNSAFVTSDPTTRVFAVEDPTVHKLYVQIYHNVSALRPIPYNNIPTL